MNATSVGRIFAVGMGALLLVALDGSRSPAYAALGSCNGGYHYAYEGTVINGAGGWYHPPTCGGDPYYGWAGINAQIAYPSTYPYVGSTNNHSAGWIGMTFSNGSWVQEGWYIGCAGGHCRTRDMGRYTEVNNVPAAFYELIDWDTAPLGGSSIFEIRPNSSGCWTLYFDYSTAKKTYCSLPTSGQAEAVAEIYTYDGNSVTMGPTAWGYSNPNTNNALRIRGANGWVAWTTSLSSGQTGYYDESSGQPGCGQPGNPPCLYYNFGIYNANYYVHGWGQ